MTMKKEYALLIGAAKKARKNAYAPYSNFKVGAAVLTKKGSLYTGVNVENVSFGLTSCAERNALYRALAEGEKEFVAVAVVASGSALPMPCGACRQVISEFGDNIALVVSDGKNRHEVHPIRELLKHPFTIKKRNR